MTDEPIRITSTFTREVRRDVLEMSFRAGTAHVPSALSMVDYLSVVFAHFVDPREDRLLLGKPFGAQAYYAIFHRLGWLAGDLHQYGTTEDPHWTYIMGREHPLVRFIDDTMGNALSVACGIAMASRRRVYINVGDAYFQAGSAWEAIMLAGARRLDTVLMTIDNNGMQVLGRTRDVLDVEPLDARLNAFGWRTFRVNGHDLSALRATFTLASRRTGRPTAVICDTIKGKGVSFMQGDSSWHYRLLTAASLADALGQLE